VERQPGFPWVLAAALGKPLGGITPQTRTQAEPVLVPGTPVG